jgi:hypothetical protein
MNEMPVFGSLDIDTPILATYTTEVVQCDCRMLITSTDFEEIRERHMAYCEEMDRRKNEIVREKLLEFCRTEL